MHIHRPGDREAEHPDRADRPRAGVDARYRDVFSAWLPLKADLDPDASVGSNLRAVEDEFTAVQQRGWLRRDSVGRDEQLRELWSSGALIPDVLVSWAGAPSATGDGQSPLLELAVLEDTETVEFRFDAARLSRSDAERLAVQFGDWCARLPAVASSPLASAEPVSADERRSLIEEFNATADNSLTGHRLHRLYEQAAAAHADRTALVCGEDQLTYAELNGRANRLARTLVDRGVRRGDLVGVALDRSIDLVVALLAVLKAGAAYVPIDPAFPAERIRLVIDSAEPKLVVTPAAPPANLAAWPGLCLGIDRAPAEDSADVTNADVTNADVTNLDIDVDADDLAYVIYTSGSTGRPKGVEVSHGALCNFLASMLREPGCAEDDRLLAVTTVSFDIAVLELFLPLLCGARTVIAQAHEVADVDALLGLLRRHGITMMQGTPATWQLLLDSGWRGDPGPAKILCGGEALPRRLADRLLGCGGVWNMYGPTETTVWSSAWQVRADGDVVIGNPIANTQLYVLDQHLSPVPLGFPGELCIGGAGVARGYHGDDEQTRSRFVPNPFHPGLLFRTGDLARFTGPGR
ncbi:amino acid adenylation domain-containing protein [Streptacidiphilus sp. 4-A2]|nr:amino acid adenylation domain-containing protein [Streptacidiphilus sp. 4-A2]